MECSDRLCIRFVYEGHKVYCGSDIALRIRDSRMDLIHTSNNSPLKRKTISAARPFTRSALIFEDPGGATLTNRASISFLYSILENGMDVFIRLHNYNTAYWKLQALFQKNISQDSKNPRPDSLCIAQKSGRIRYAPAYSRSLLLSHFLTDRSQAFFQCTSPENTGWQTSLPFSASSTSVVPVSRLPARISFAMSVSAALCRYRFNGRAP